MVPGNYVWGFLFTSDFLLEISTSRNISKAFIKLKMKWLDHSLITFAPHFRIFRKTLILVGRTPEHHQTSQLFPLPLTFPKSTQQWWVDGIAGISMLDQADRESVCVSWA